ncbi:MAG TPA: NADH-quinone oxidoreductase subunit L, partial [Bacteroidales bacterium]|nr:NADH-quinone oxidoreductase subunit L [Bacteroidales bacterium]
MTDFNYTLWIFLIPFLVFILLGLAGHRLKARISGLLGTAALGVVTVLSYITAYFYYFRTAGINDVFRKITVFDSTWLHFTDTLEIKMGILLDPISVMMLIVI